MNLARICMTIRRRWRAGAALSCVFLAAPHARSQALIWTGGGANANWSTVGNWNSGVPSLTVGSTQTLSFTGTTGLTSTMNNSYSAASLTFGPSAGAFTVGLGAKILTLDGGAPTISQQAANDETLSAGTLAFSSNGIISVTGTGLLAISSKLSGTADISKQGSGLLALSGAGTGFSGDLTITSGTVQVSTSNTVLGTGVTIVDAGATLSLTDGRSLSNALTVSGTGVAGAGAIESSAPGTATLSGPIALAGDTTVNATAGTLKLSGGISGTGTNLTLNGAGSITVSGDVTTGTGGITVNSTGTTTLSGSNTYTGTTVVNAGTVDLTSTAVNGDLTINGGTVLDKTSGQFASTSNLAINGGTFNLNGKTESIASVAGTSAATLALGTGTLTDSQSSSTAFAGSLTGSGTLAMQGTGKLSITGTNAGFTGAVALSNGTINASATNATGTGTVTVSNLGNFQVQGGVTLANKFNLSTTGGGNGAIENVSGTNSVSGAVTVSGASRIQSDSGTLTFTSGVALAGNSLNVGGAGNTTLSGAITGTAASSLSKDGTGTLALGTANPAFQGSVTISGGTLQTSVANAFKNTTAITFFSGSILDLNNTSQVIGTLNGAGTVAFGSGGALTLSTGNDLLSGAFTGTGTLTLSAGSVLTLGAGFSDPNLNIVMAGGTLKLNGTTDTFGSLSITASSIIDFANPATSVLSVNGVSLSGASQLTVNNWADMVDYFYSTSSPGTQGTAPINQIVFNGFSGNQTRWNTDPSGPGLSNEISPIPEASRYGAVLTAICLVAAVILRGRAPGKAPWRRFRWKSRPAA